MSFLRTLRSRWIDERGAAGWLIVGILIGIGLVVFGVIKFLIPGD